MVVVEIDVVVFGVLIASKTVAVPLTLFILTFEISLLFSVFVTNFSLLSTVAAKF